jgi:hypothetical protein
MLISRLPASSTCQAGHELNSRILAAAEPDQPSGIQTAPPAFTGAANMSDHSLWHRRRGTAGNAANDQRKQQDNERL